ncbi:MAG: hypothetical protein ACKOYP_04225 [Bacteroidota bacterium]
MAPQADRLTAEGLLVSAGVTLAEKIGASSLHITFPTGKEWADRWYWAGTDLPP